MNKKHVISIMILLCCYLGVYGSKLAIWQEGQSKPIQVLPYDISIFPQEDQSRLVKGIPFADQKELSRLLEDFSS